MQDAIIMVCDTRFSGYRSRLEIEHMSRYRFN